MPFMINEEELVDLLYAYYEELLILPEKNLDHIQFMQFLQYVLSLYIEEDAS